MNLFKRSPKAVSMFQEMDDTLIKFEDLLEFPTGITFDIDPKDVGSILCTRIVSYSDGISFRVEMINGKFWQLHHHDCIETILMYKGTLIDLLNNRTVVRGQLMEIPANKSHYIKSNGNCIFYVDFKNPNK